MRTGTRYVVVLIAMIALVGIACSGPATATPTATPTPTVVPTATAAPTPTATLTAASTPVAAALCAETPDATPSATVYWNIPVVGGEPTISAGQAVAFITTERTFYQPGDYSITCRKAPETMHTVVHVVA